MLRTLMRRLFGDPHRHDQRPPLPAGPGHLRSGGRTVEIAGSARWHEGIGHPRWPILHAAVEALPEQQQDAGWLDLQRAWLDWLRGSIGLRYRLHDSDSAFLLSSLPPRLAEVKLAYLAATERRISRTLEELADASGKEVLIAFDSDSDYYRYVSGFYPAEGRFAMSAGMHLSEGCPHFVTHGTDLERIEPTIVHEMTHSCLQHLPLPLWLNEGIAQSVEYRFCPYAIAAQRRSELRAQHAEFWSIQTIQAFWSGDAFDRIDQGRTLSYDLALTLVEAFARDWPAFKAFTLAAQHGDAGASAARAHLGIELGEVVALLLGHDSAGDWSPGPGTEA